MSGFAQAVRRQGGLKDFSIGLDQIAKVIADRKLKRKMEDQTSQFKKDQDFYANNIKSVYSKAAEDQAITPFESAEMSKGLYDFRNNMNNYPLVDKELRSSADTALSELTKNLGTTVTPKEPEKENWKNTEDYFNKNSQFELDKIAREYEEKKKLEEAKAKLKSSSDSKTSDKEVKIDRSKLRGEISKGISQIKNLKKQLYTDKTKTGIADPKTVIDKLGNESQAYEIIDSQGIKSFDSPEQFTKYKEAIKNEYIPKMQELITKAGLDGALPIIRKGIEKGMKPEEAIKLFAETNNLPQDDIQDLTNWFTLFGL